MSTPKLPETLSFVLYERDYVAFNYYMAWSNPKLRWKRLLRKFLYPLLLLLIMSSKVMTKGIQPLDCLFLVLFILYAIFVDKYIYWRLMRKVKKIIKPNDQSVYGLKEFTFTEQILLVKEGLSKSEASWNSFSSLEENEEHFFLFVSKASSWIIPKRAFKNNNDLENFKQFINSKIKG